MSHVSYWEWLAPVAPTRRSSPPLLGFALVGIEINSHSIPHPPTAFHFPLFVVCSAHSTHQRLPPAPRAPLCLLSTLLHFSVTLLCTIFATHPPPAPKHPCNPPPPVRRPPQVGARFQLERLGYFAVDTQSAAGALVFNRTVSLKESKPVSLKK